MAIPPDQRKWLEISATYFRLRSKGRREIYKFVDIILNSAMASYDSYDSRRFPVKKDQWEQKVENSRVSDNQIEC